LSATGSNPALQQPPRTGRAWKTFAIRLLLTALVLVIWFWSQSLIGSRGQTNAGIHDGLHQITEPVNHYLQSHAAAANALLVISSGIIELLGIFLLARWLFGGSSRPFLGLIVVLGLRQIMQMLIALPAPPNAIWHYPGFPSLLVTYGVSNDYFFSGHTAIAVLGAIELARLGRRWLTTVGALVVLFEVATVLALRAHYTMDVFTGAVTAFFAAHLADSFSRLRA
jgi:PAP2 superfamily protein